jgi:hypothetical protein
MGKGVIVEHLGDAHYRIGLDIDVSYARDQLAAINLYLDEFAAKYQEATDAKNEAQAALAPINARLTEYLADAQAASQAAYDAMVAAYDAWVDAVANQPDPEIIAPLREAMDVWFDGFATTHNDYILALDGDEQAPLPIPDALEARTHALQQLTLAMGDWLGAVGVLIDPAAVNTAFDALGLALDDFEAATVAYAADPGNPTLKSAMNYYQGVYETAHADWVKAVDDNSGDAAVKAARDAYDAAAETFDNARAALGKLLDNGGMPPELADIMAEQERAYATYRGALQNWQSMTLIKTEKETAKAELMSRLLPFTNNDGEPVRQTVNAWCCDATEDIAVGAEVATIEIPSERDLGVRVRPAYESRETYSAARDGKLQPSWSSSPEATYWNWALHPGNARWNPNYRLGEILFIDPLTDKCTVQLDPQRNNEKSRARDGNTLDVINPVKYQIDPDTGEQTPILPGNNVQVSDGVTTLTDVPIEYMECNAAVFEVGDHVMVEFQNRDWKQPKVIGFAENPKPCSIRGIVLSASGVDTFTQVKDGTSTFSHPKLPVVGGNYDWTSADKKICLTWNGPPGRAIRNRIEPLYYGDSSPIISANTTHGSVRLLQYLGDDYKGPGYIVIDDLGPYVWRDGVVFSQAPAGHVVIGATVIKHTEETSPGANQTYTYLVMITRRTLPDQANLLNDDIAHKLYWYWGQVAGTEQVTTLNQFYELSLYDHGALPAISCFSFSGTGYKCAGLIPARSIYNYSIQLSPDIDKPSAGVGNDLIVSAEFLPSSEGVTISNIQVTDQAHSPAAVIAVTTSTVEDQPGSGIIYKGDVSTTFSRQQDDSAIVAIDFVGEVDVTLTATYVRDQSGACTVGVYDDTSLTGTASDYYTVSTTASDSIAITLRDAYRSRVLNVLNVSATHSANASGVPGTDIGNGSTSDNLTSVRPVFYDLRNGAYLAESGTASTSIIDYRDTSISLEKSLIDHHGKIYNTITRSQSNSYGSGGAGSIDTTRPFATSGLPTGQEAGSSACNAMALPWELQWTIRSGSLEGESFVERYARWSNIDSLAWQINYMPEYVDWQTRRKSYEWGTYITKTITTMPVYCQPTGSELVARVTPIELTPQFDGLAIHFASKEPQNVVLASGFDVDTAWQTHLDTKHPPADGDPAITQTALEADLKPLFRR